MINKVIKWIPFILLYVPFKFFSFFYKSQKDILLFGTGTSLYHDNSKYLFEYILSNIEQHSEFEVYWVAKNKKLYKELKELSIPVLYYNSLECAKYTSIANTYFVTSGLLDVFWFINNKTKLIQLWHGTPIKKIGYDTIIDQERLKKQKFLFSSNYQFDRYDYLIIEDKKYIDIFQSAFQVKNKKILPLGQPRNTIFNADNNNILLINNIKVKLKIKTFKKVILYAPTYRDNFDLNVSLIKNILTIENKDYLKTNNYCLLVKLHPLLSERKEINRLLYKINKEIINIVNIIDMQELLLISDAVVTDISSLALDYLHYSSNLYRFFPDQYEYIKLRGNFYQETYGELINNSNSIDSLKELNFNSEIFKSYSKDLVCQKILKLIVINSNV